MSSIGTKATRCQNLTPKKHSGVTLGYISEIPREHARRQQLDAVLETNPVTFGFSIEEYGENPLRLMHAADD